MYNIGTRLIPREDQVVGSPVNMLHHDLELQSDFDP
jgi:hypothetical protein